METVEKSIVVDAPLTTVYNQWTQFEEFPRFMKGVKEVRQLGNDRLFWHAEILGQDKEWEAEIYEQIPDRRISWRSVSGTETAGAVHFEPLGMNQTRVTLSMQYQPEGAAEHIADAFGLVSTRVQGDLERFKTYIEERQSETGAWRGTIRQGRIEP